MEITCCQAIKPSRSPVITGPKISPKLPPMPKMASEAPFLAEKRRDISAIDGKCHTDVATDTNTMPMMRYGYTVAMPIISQLKPNMAMQAAMITPR